MQENEVFTAIPASARRMEFFRRRRSHHSNYHAVFPLNRLMYNLVIGVWTSAFRVEWKLPVNYGESGMRRNGNSDVHVSKRLEVVAQRARLPFPYLVSDGSIQDGKSLNISARSAALTNVPSRDGACLNKTAAFAQCDTVILSGLQ